MDLITKKIARFLFAIPFAIFGLMHFTAGEEMTAMVPFPGAISWIYFTGGALVLASISILTKKKDTLASILLGIMLILFVAIVHIPALMDGDQMALSAILKDTSLAGAAFTYAGFSRKPRYYS